MTTKIRSKKDTPAGEPKPMKESDIQKKVAKKEKEELESLQLFARFLPVEGELPLGLELAFGRERRDQFPSLRHRSSQVAPIRALSCL